MDWFWSEQSPVIMEWGQPTSIEDRVSDLFATEPSSHSKVAARIPDHLLWIYDPVELLRADEASVHRGVAQGRILIQRLMGDRRSLVIADDGAQRGHQHE